MIRDLVASDPGIHDGALVFAGTSVPVQTLLDYRRAHVPVYEFLIDHPTVQPAQAKKFLKWMAQEGPQAAQSKLDQLRRSPR